MAETIFRYINGVVRPIMVNKVTKGQRLATTANSCNQVPKHKLPANHYKAPNAFTIPNVTCQRCGAKVFYYEHPNGARVLFDQLGPPWPKHPCYEVAQKGKVRKSAVTKPFTDWASWKQGLWSPVIVQANVLSEDGKNVKIMAIGESQRVFFELPLSLLRNRGLTLASVADLLIQIQEISASAFNVQLHDGKSFWCVTGYRSEVEDEKEQSGSLSFLPQAMMPNLKTAIQPDYPRLSDKSYRKLKKVKRFEYHWGEQAFVVTLHEDSIRSVVKIASREALIFRDLELQWEAMLGKRSKGGYRRLLMVNPTTRHFFSCLLDADTLKPREEQGAILSMNESVVKEPGENLANKDGPHAMVATMDEGREPKVCNTEAILASIECVGDNYLVVRFQLDAFPVCFALHRASQQSQMILTALLEQDQVPRFMLKPLHSKKTHYEVYLGSTLLGSMIAMKNQASSADLKQVIWGSERNSKFL
ncbi:MAG: hypothetical protein ACRCSS_02745 [Shewanella sp.]